MHILFPLTMNVDVHRRKYSEKCNQNCLYLSMRSNLLKYKGIHPGIILERELEKRSIKQRPFALSISELPQTLNAITKGKRRMNTACALKVEKALRLKEGTFVLLQAYYDIALEKRKQVKPSPDFKKLRKVLFWDTDINKVDWQKQGASVIKRVFERGNEAEKEEITRFYGKRKVNAVLKTSGTQPMKLYQNVPKN